MSSPARPASPTCRRRRNPEYQPWGHTGSEFAGAGTPYSRGEELTQEPVFPSEIRLEDNAIVIIWDDGHRSPYAHRYLRLRCPCASCVEEMTGRPILDPDSIPANIKAIDHLPVGNYGVQFLWDDAHYTGIYTYRALRAACTCIICNEARAEAAAQGG